MICLKKVTITNTMVTKAFDNDLADGSWMVKAFRRVGRKLRRGENARKWTLTVDEYLRLVDGPPLT